MSFWVSIPFDNFISYFDFYYCVAKVFVAFILTVSSDDDTRFTEVLDSRWTANCIS